MRRLLLVLLGTAERDACGGVTRRDGAAHMLRSGIPLMSLALLIVGCAGHSLVPKEQALAIETQDRTLALHANTIHEAIRQSGNLGALAFLDTRDGHLVILPGNSPTDAWARYNASPPETSPPGRALVPAVVSFVYRADVPKAPETVTHLFLQQHQALGTSLIALDTEQRALSDAIAATKQETLNSIAVAREDMQKALNSLAEDLAAARKFMLQTAQLGWLNHELNVENASGIRKAARASEQLTSDSARLADTMRQLSESLASQLKELANRLDGIQSKLSNVK
jgi:hypothetical protein